MGKIPTHILSMFKTFDYTLTPNNVREHQIVVFGDNEQHRGAGGLAGVIRSPREVTLARSVGISSKGVHYYGVVVKRAPVDAEWAFMDRIPDGEIKSLEETVERWEEKAPEREFLITQIGTGLARIPIGTVASQLRELLIFDNVRWDQSLLECAILAGPWCPHYGPLFIWQGND